MSVQQVRGDVYMNIRERQLSIVDRTSTDSPTYGNVIDSTQAARVENADIVTYEGKRNQAKESGQKNVHAMFRGDVVPVEEVPDRGRDLYYTVEKPGCFYTADTDERVLEADVVLIDVDGGARAIGVETPEETV